MKNKSLLYGTLVLVLALGTCLWCSARDVVRVGLAWKSGLTSDDRVAMAIKAAGAEAVVLEQVRHSGLDYDSTTLAKNCVDADGVLLDDCARLVKRDSWHASNAEQVMRGVDAVVFLGGGDISSTLFREPQQWGGETCDATRDVSEFLTMSYCLDHDIPVLGLCRGMQMLAVVSGASMIQDLDTHFEANGINYNHLHRSLRDKQGNRYYTPHDVLVTDHNSLLYSIEMTDTITCVPSWHHQVVADVTGTPLKVTGVTPTQGTNIIEAIERTDKEFALGVQYHPEEAVRQHLTDAPGASQFMRLYRGVAYFWAMIKHVENKRKNK